MAWVFLALLAALTTTIRDAAAKRASDAADPILVAFGIALIPALGLGTLVLFRPLPDFGDGFVQALLLSGGINALATPLIVWALKRSDLSLVAPLTSLTPLFMLGTAALVLGERPTPTGAAGVTVIVVGAYLLNLSERRVSLLEPLRALIRDPGARAMLLVAALYSVSASFDKVGVRTSSPLVWAAAVQGVVAVSMGIVLVGRARIRPSPDRGAGRAAHAGRARGVIALAGIVMMAGLVAQNVALTLTLAAYVIAVKRTSTLFGVLLGRSIFGETRTRERLVGAAVMLAGFVLVVLGGGS